MAKFVRLYSTSLGSEILVNVDQVIWIQGCDDHTRIYLASKGYTIVRETPDQVVALLTDPTRDPGLHE